MKTIGDKLEAFSKIDIGRRAAVVARLAALAAAGGVGSTARAAARAGG
jgi:hypothetical protein